MTHASSCASRAAWAVSLVVLAFTLANCADPGGPSFITLGVTMTGTTMSAAATATGGTSGENPAGLCIRLPVLLGSRVEAEKSFTGGLGAKLDADREQASVTFTGADDASADRTYTVSELEQGVSETVSVSANEILYEARIASGCTNP